ncbi:leucyl/phenylalanyl-tRNA--protein transferase [Dyella choica]|uniref:Leucyl/phenylalanyl-tRNA--protein transferase n=1 Tax=Dyella choica TaxID=1927959 RepID=A0A3S0SCE4_9GAMM|nr:leucyl/phenylalanyl-tRNA--protein transferase [Dyella choica]RUL79648.1 leucyl/phenylalanyl-tRNA--protein transferase [Dyella choica]
MIRLTRLDDHHPGQFPDPRSALVEPNGLLAFGGDLSPPRLMAAYEHGIFPWFNEGEPILWWSPDPRCVFHTDRLRPNRSLRRALKDTTWQVSVDRAFRQVMQACAAPRPGQFGTWIGSSMIDSYSALHNLGHAHSVEVWEQDRLVGGIYGVSIGRLFCGESMFSAQSGGSKLALCALASLLRAWEFPLIDAQVSNPHLLGLGAVEIPRELFLRKVRASATTPFHAQCWKGLPMIPAQRILEGGGFL